MKIDVIVFTHDNVGSLYGPGQAEWLAEHGHKVNTFSINDWTKNQNKINDTDSDVLMTWGFDQHLIGDFIKKIPSFNRDKYRHVVHSTTEPVYTRFAFWRNGSQNAKTQHIKFLRRLRPTIVCYACREDYYLSEHRNKLWFCNNRYRQVKKVEGWEHKEDKLYFAGKKECWEHYQHPDYKGLSRPQQIDIAKRALGDKFVWHGPNTFNMHESQSYYNRYRYSFCPRSGHIFHPRISVATQVRSIPIIIIPDHCPEMKWFPEIKHGYNCFLIKDSNLKNIKRVLKGTKEICENARRDFTAIHNFESSMQELIKKLEK